MRVFCFDLLAQCVKARDIAGHPVDILADHTQDLALASPSESHAHAGSRCRCWTSTCRPIATPSPKTAHVSKPDRRTRTEPSRIVPLSPPSAHASPGTPTRAYRRRAHKHPALTPDATPRPPTRERPMRPRPPGLSASASTNSTPHLTVQQPIHHPDQPIRYPPSSSSQQLTRSRPLPLTVPSPDLFNTRPAMSLEALQTDSRAVGLLAIKHTTNTNWLEQHKDACTGHGYQVHDRQLEAAASTADSTVHTADAAKEYAPLQRAEGARTGPEKTPREPQDRGHTGR